MRFDITLFQDEGINRCLASDKPSLEIKDCSFRTKKECMHYALDKLLESPKKYVQGLVSNNEGDIVMSFVMKR